MTDRDSHISLYIYDIAMVHYLCDNVAQDAFELLWALHEQCQVLQQEWKTASNKVEETLQAK